MTSWKNWALGATLGWLLSGCVTQDDINRAVSDELRFSGKLVGFALEQGLEAVDVRLALLKTFAGDPRRKQLEALLGTVAQLEARRDRLREAKRALVEENKKLRARYRPSDEQ
ncbi:MAG: hypothetical protein D6731_04535 [Planctomycetota bacterium]|nr:MAG: hypothetical protein D6731_04535 [Planctomycetota bacterium]